MHRDEVLLVLVALTLPLGDVRDVHHCSSTEAAAWSGCHGCWQPQPPAPEPSVPNPPGTSTQDSFVTSCSHHFSCVSSTDAAVPWPVLHREVIVPHQDPSATPRQMAPSCTGLSAGRNPTPTWLHGGWTCCQHRVGSGSHQTVTTGDLKAPGQILAKISHIQKLSITHRQGVWCRMDRELQSGHQDNPSVLMHSPECNYMPICSQFTW